MLYQPGIHVVVGPQDHPEIDVGVAELRIPDGGVVLLHGPRGIGKNLFAHLHSHTLYVLQVAEVAHAHLQINGHLLVRVVVVGGDVVGKLGVGDDHGVVRQQTNARRPPPDGVYPSNHPAVQLHVVADPDGAVCHDAQTGEHVSESSLQCEGYGQTADAEAGQQWSDGYAKLVKYDQESHRNGEEARQLDCHWGQGLHHALLSSSDAHAPKAPSDGVVLYPDCPVNQHQNAYDRVYGGDNGLVVAQRRLPYDTYVKSYKDDLERQRPIDVVYEIGADAVRALPAQPALDHSEYDSHHEGDYKAG